MQADNESLPDSEMLFDDADRGLLLTAEDGQIKRDRKSVV